MPQASERNTQWAVFDRKKRQVTAAENNAGKPNEPCIIRGPAHDEIWFPDSPLGRIIAERLKREGWEVIR